MRRQSFATLVFQGDRFKAAMPVQVLAELAAYQELVLAVARGLFAERNPKRKKLPNGFTDSFQLFLERVEDGSAVPILLRETSPATEALAAKLGLDYFEDARGVVERCIGAAALDQPLPPEMSVDALAKFNAFGRTLSDDDAIIVAAPGTRQGPRYTKAVRRKLVLRGHDEFEDDVGLVGTVISAAREPVPNFVLRTIDTYQRVEVRASTFFERAARAVADESTVVLTGTGMYDATGKLTRVTSVADLSVAEEDPEAPRPGCRLSLEDQVRNLEHLAPGWYDADSPSFARTDLTWIAHLFKGVVESFDLPNPYVYPTPEGEVRVEWSGEPWEVSVVVDTKHRRSEVFATQVMTGEIHENAFALAEAGAESKMGRFLSQHFHGRFAT
jgi:hypothetical protein